MRLDKHPILVEAYNVVMAIEECGASEKLTHAVIKASELAESIDKLLDEHEKAITTTLIFGCTMWDNEQMERIIAETKPAELSEKFIQELPIRIERAK